MDSLNLWYFAVGGAAAALYANTEYVPIQIRPEKNYFDLSETQPKGKFRKEEDKHKDARIKNISQKVGVYATPILNQMRKSGGKSPVALPPKIENKTKRPLNPFSAKKQ